MPSVDTIIAKTRDYLDIPSVVGFEGLFLDQLEQEFLTMKLQTVRGRNLLAVCGKKPDSAIVCAHIDRHGLISLGNGEYAYAAQYIREIKYGEENASSRKLLETISNRFHGEIVFAYDPLTGERLGEGKIETCRRCLESGDSIFFVRGMEDVRLGMPLAYARRAREERVGRHHYFKGQIDNAISAGAVYALFADGFEGTALLSCEEEIGKSWIHISDYLSKFEIETRNLIVIDTSPFEDPEPIEKGRVILRNRDKSEIFNKKLTQALKERCERLKIPCQVKDEYLIGKGKTTEELGSTELGKLILNTNRRWSGGSVQIPTLAYHTSNETTTRVAIKNYYACLHNILVEEPFIS